MLVRILDCQPGWLIATPAPSPYWGHIAHLRRGVGLGVVIVTFWACDGGGTRAFPAATRVHVIER